MVSPLWHPMQGLHRASAKYQELTVQREQENLQRAKAILERRKSERDRLNAYMHSVGNPNSKNPDHIKRMRRPNMEGMFGRPPWTASLRNDYETLIKLREKEIAVAALRIETHKHLPNEIEQELGVLEPELGYERFTAIQTSNESNSVQNDMKELKNDLFRFTNEARDVGRNLNLLLEPTVFREHSCKPSARLLPPAAPTPNPKPLPPSLKPCLKPNMHNQKSLVPPSNQTPRQISQVRSERYMSCATPEAASKTETESRPVTNGPQTTAHPNPQPAIDICIPEQMLPVSAASFVEEFTILRPILGHQIEGALSCSDADEVVQENQTGTSSPADVVQGITSTPESVLQPPRYTSTCESWQEDQVECRTPPVYMPLREDREDKPWSGSDDEMLFTSLDSEAATTRLIAEVTDVQSRLEDCKLKPLDFRNVCADSPPSSPLPSTGRGTAIQHTREDSITQPPTQQESHDLLSLSQKHQGVIEVTMWHHEFFIPEGSTSTHDHDIKESNLDDSGYREEEKTERLASNATVGASSVDDEKKKDINSTTAKSATHRTDNFTEMHSYTFEETSAPRKNPLHGASWEIPWKNGADTTPSRGVESHQPHVKHVLLQTDESALYRNGQCTHLPKCEEPALPPPSTAPSTGGPRSDSSLLSTKRTSKYLNIGYKDLNEAPRPKYPKQHCFYSSNGLLQVGYSQPPSSRALDPPQGVAQQRNVTAHRDSLGDKENYGMGGSDDQELSILASLERLDWKLAAMSARVKNRTSITPSMVSSQNQNSTQSAPAATGVQGTPHKLPSHPLRPSSVKTLKPPTRNFRRRRIVGVTNKFHQDIYN